MHSLELHPFCPKQADLQQHTMKTSPGSVSLVHPGFFKLVALAAAVAAMTACSSIAPNPVQTAELAATTQADRAAISQAVAPFSAPLTLDEALARALKVTNAPPTA